MKKIIKIKYLKSGVKVSFDDETIISLLPSILSNFNLYINKIIDNKEIELVKKENRIEELFVFITKKLVLNEYSPRKIEELLYKKNAKKDEIRLVMEKLRKFDFINEEKLVSNLLEISDIKHYGYNRIIKLLNDRKISKQEIGKVKYNLKREEKEAKLLFNILEKKYKNKNEYQRQKAVYSGLVRNGFDESLSLELVNNFSNSNHNNELNVLKLDYSKCYLKYSKELKDKELDRKITDVLLGKGYKMSDINYVKEKENEISKRFS